MQQSGNIKRQPLATRAAKKGAFRGGPVVSLPADLERIVACQKAWREKLAACGVAHRAYWNDYSMGKVSTEAYESFQNSYRECRRAQQRLREATRRALKRGTRQDLKAISEWEKTWRKAARVSCYWCGKRLSGRMCHADHVIPLSANGAHAVENLVVICPECNLGKCAKLPEKWRRQLRRRAQKHR